MDAITNRINRLEERIEKLEKLLAAPGATVVKPKKMSAKEFLMTKNLKSEVQKVLAIGYFLEHVEIMESFNITDLEMAFRAAKEKLPKNMNDAVNKNIARGLLMGAEIKKDSKKAWYLTSTGERYLESELNIDNY